MTTLHVFPLQLKLTADLGVEIVCDDPLAHIDRATGTLTISLPVERRKLRPGHEDVRFVARAPSAAGIYNYVSMLSGSSADRLVVWWHEGGVVRSPHVTAPSLLEIWATVLAIPDGDPTAARVYKGRRNVKIDYQGGGDPDIV